MPWLPCRQGLPSARLTACLLTELPARSIDVRTAFSPDAALDMGGEERFSEPSDGLFDRAGERGAIDRVHRNQIHVHEHPSTEGDECIQLFARVGYTGDERVLEGRPSSGRLRIVDKGASQLCERNSADARHEQIAGGLHGRVQ